MLSHEKYEFFYWTKFLQYDDFFQFMAENITKADIIIVFFSKDSFLAGSIVELHYALKLNKTIIPVIEKGTKIPLVSRIYTHVGYDPIEYDLENFNQLLVMLNEVINSVSTFFS